MTEKQYLKFLMDVNLNVMKLLWCPKCKHKETCDKKLKEYCVKKYAEKTHKGNWTFEKGLAKEQEQEKRLKEKIKELKVSKSK